MISGVVISGIGGLGHIAVQYAVIQEKVYESFYKLSNPTSQIEAYVYDVVRSSVPKIKLDDVFTTKDEISANIKRELTESMSDYGFYIQATRTLT